MQFRFVIILLLIVYIFSGYVYENTITTSPNHSMNLQKEIYIDESEVQVFKRNSVNDISVVEKKIKVWMIEVKYDDNNLDNIRNKLISNGYKLKNDKLNTIISIGPFTALSHAKQESDKLNKILGIDNKISSFIF